MAENNISQLLDVEDAGDLNVTMGNEEYFVNSIRVLKMYVASTKNPNTDRKTQSTVKKFKEFIEKEGSLTLN